MERREFLKNISIGLPGLVLLYNELADASTGDKCNRLVQIVQKNAGRSKESPGMTMNFYEEKSNDKPKLYGLFIREKSDTFRVEYTKYSTVRWSFQHEDFESLSIETYRGGKTLKFYDTSLSYWEHNKSNMDVKYSLGHLDSMNDGRLNIGKSDKEYPDALKEYKNTIDHILHVLSEMGVQE